LRQSAGRTIALSGSSAASAVEALLGLSRTRGGSSHRPTAAMRWSVWTRCSWCCPRRGGYAV